ncbi:MAG: DUF6259 domain-containing protein [Candidatus Dormibacteraceae bacterium]
MHLTGDLLTVEIEPTTGRLLEIRHRGLDVSLIGERRLAENWRLLVPIGEWRGHYIFGSEQKVSSIEASPDGRRATVTWSGLRSRQGEFDITVRMTVVLEGDDVTFSLMVENRSGAVVEEVIFPAIGGMANPEERDSWRLHHTTVVGVGNEWPVFDEFPGTYLGPAAPVWFSGYPSQMSMPWVDVYDAVHRRGFMLVNRDPRPAAAFSMAFAQLFPCSNWRGAKQYWPDPAHSGDEPVGMTLAWACFPFVRSGAVWESPPVALHFHQGTWYAAADHYREWFDRTIPWAIDKSHSWLSEQDAWQSTIISYPEGTIGYRFTDLPQLAAEAKRAGIRVLQIDGWDQGGIDRDYPIYVPDPRLGTADELQAAISSCRALGVEILLFANLQWAHIETDWWRQELHRYAVQDPRGFVRNSSGWEYHTLLGLAAQCEPRMVPMDPAHPEFDRIIRDQLLGAARLGSGGMQIDKLLGGFGIDYTPGLPLPPDEAMNSGVLSSLMGFLNQARQQNPRFCIAGETHWDRLIPFVDVSYSRFFSEEHLPTTQRAFPEYRQTCCVVGHWDFGLINNSLRYGHVVNVETRCLHGSAADAPGLAAYLKEVLALRRSLWDVLWHSQIAEPVGIEVEADSDLRYTLHQSRSGQRSALVLNHFARDSRKARVSLPELGRPEVQVHRPGEQPVTLRAPLDIELGPDQVAVLIWQP